jgi:ribosomal protein S27E
MSEPSYVVDCPYCSAIVILFKDKDSAECKACGGVMRILHEGEAGYDEWKAKLNAKNKVKRRE